MGPEVHREPVGTLLYDEGSMTSPSDRQLRLEIWTIGDNPPHTIDPKYSGFGHMGVISGIYLPFVK